MEIFTEGCVEQDPRLRRLISPNHWKAVSGEKTWGWGWLEEGRFSYLRRVKGSFHMLVRGFLFIGNLIIILIRPFS